MSAPVASKVNISPRHSVSMKASTDDGQASLSLQLISSDPIANFPLLRTSTSFSV
jgi:hypothetical protein